MTSSPALPRVRISTPLGSITVVVDTARAPLTASNFLRYVDEHLLDRATIYRIVSQANQPPTVSARIEVVQFGLVPGNNRYPTPLPPIVHEPTGQTGLRHRDGTLSMARFEPGTASSGFFLCIGEQPELDQGGKRHPDGLGFAAFGWVEDGLDVLHALHGQAEATDMLEQPIQLLGLRRV